MSSDGRPEIRSGASSLAPTITPSATTAPSPAVVVEQVRVDRDNMSCLERAPSEPRVTDRKIVVDPDAVGEHDAGVERSLASGRPRRSAPAAVAAPSRPRPSRRIDRSASSAVVAPGGDMGTSLVRWARRARRGPRSRPSTRRRSQPRPGRSPDRPAQRLSRLHVGVRRMGTRDRRRRVASSAPVAGAESARAAPPRAGRKRSASE